ncbi:esterase [Lacihabitans sp. LS3-19]|uniref:alpha/beta hydrolase-fold protein n=1 Tax=Lacihabitans sp. LS3-19 TaxID=2487335 RepID=UPI0020CF8E36|nr:alpha/beta hydrolase-fold protein [Lacihabitans sp. LS3-19]MCP9768362.1 esterase [Lacihabitans sp. LS3-19]
MKKIAVLIICFLGFSPLAFSQKIEKEMPTGYELSSIGSAKGKIDSITYASKTVGSVRKALVYTPPGYNKKTKYPVFYLLHGIGGDEKEWLKGANPQVILDNLFNEGKIQPMIVVMPNGRAMKDDRAVGNIFDKEKVEAFATFEKDLLNDLIPFIDKKYPTLMDKDNRAIAGLSMGGGQSLNFGLGNLDTFSWVGGFSSAPNTKAPKELMPNPETAKDKLKFLWLSCGDKDGLLTFTKRTHEYMYQNNVPHVYYLEPGVHDFKVWKNGLYMFSQFLFKPVDTASLTSYTVLGTPASTNIRNAAYPQILPDNRVVFKTKAPNAQKVQIDLSGKHDMLKDEEGFWTVTTPPIGPGFHYYSLLIDDLAVADPASETFYGMGRMASGIDIPFPGDDFYALKDVAHGEVRMKRYFSNVTFGWKRYFIYTPPGYDKNTDKKYPVLYILHGGGEDERGWATQGKTDLIMDNLLAENQAEPMLIVMMDGNMYGSGGGISGFNTKALEQFTRELKDVVIPDVEANFRTKTDAKNRALAGLSMGGLQTLHAGLRNTDMFNYLGVFSSGWWSNNSDLSGPEYDFMEKNKTAINSNLKEFWISQGGKEDIAHANCQIMMKKFDEMGIKYRYSEYPGGHAWPVWRHDLYMFAPLLFK